MPDTVRCSEPFNRAVADLATVRPHDQDYVASRFALSNDGSADCLCVIAESRRRIRRARWKADRHAFEVLCAEVFDDFVPDSRRMPRARYQD